MIRRYVQPLTSCVRQRVLDDTSSGWPFLVYTEVSECYVNKPEHFRREMQTGMLAHADRTAALHIHDVLEAQHFSHDGSVLVVPFTLAPLSLAMSSKSSLSR